MLLRQIFDPQLAQYAYLVGCPRSGEALVIDPERDIDRYHALAKENGLRITAVAETHIHADFVSGAQEFAQDPSIHLYLSDEGGPDWSYAWPKGRPNTHMLKDGDTFTVGNISVKAVLTPGHTPEHISFLITDLGSGATEPIALATGDFLFMGDVGRPDLLESAAGVKNVMEPSARTLQASLAEKLSAYGDYIQILPAHGAGSACGKSLGAVPTTTLGYERRFNPPLKLALTDAESFVKDILQGQPNPPLYFATMKRVNRDGITVTGGVPSAKKLDLAEFRSLIADVSVRILDSRDNKDEFHKAHLPRSISAPLHSPFFSNSAGSFLVEHDRFVLVVENAQDVELAVRQLYRIGVDGMIGWISVAELASSSILNQTTDVRDVASFSPQAVGNEGVVVDVRTTAEYQAGHLSGALSLPYTRIREHLAEIPKGKRLYVHCASGKRASLASSFLASQGFDVVYLDGNFATCLRNASQR
jgi:hydroxyacylglutathione hydrolase